MNDSKKLFRPKYCLVPLAARTNPNIPAKAQIYLGELNILTNEYGYCWASDEQLAEMQGVSTRTILEWHRILEQEGFIKRDTVKKHVMNDERGKLDLKTERKIFVIDNPSNNFSEPQKTSCPRDVKKTSAPRDVKKTSGITIEPLTIENTTTEQVVVVVPSSPLDLLNLTQEDKLKILKEHDSKKISLLVERVKSWKGRSGDLIACNTILRDWEKWRIPVTEAKIGSEASFDQKQLLEQRKERAIRAKEKFKLNWSIKSDRIEVYTVTKSGKDSYGSMGYLQDEIEKLLQKYE